MFLRWNAFNRAEVHDTAPMSEGKTEIISCRTEDASDKLVIYLQDSVHEGEGLKVGDLQSLFSPALSDADVKRVLTAQGFEAGRHSIAKGQMRCWTFNGTPATRLHIPTVRR